MKHTQQNLIDLIGLKITDEKLISHFDSLGLKPPKACSPQRDRGGVDNKAENISYYTGYEVTHESCHPPKLEGKTKKWTTYLRSISFVSESNLKKGPDTKPADFWNVSPPPTANLAALKAYFGEEARADEYSIQFKKRLNDLVEIDCRFSIKDQRINTIAARIIEERELISYLYFRDLAPGESDEHGNGMPSQSFMCMLVKWLHDNKNLNAAQNEALPADNSAILSFVRRYFKGKIWQNHLVNQDRMFANFISDGTSLIDENGTQLRLLFQKTGLKALGMLDEYNRFEADYDKQKEAGKSPDESYWEQQEKFMKNIPVNEANYALYAKALDDSFTLYNRLMKLPVNRERYHFD